jgi:hypothetical protein
MKKKELTKEQKQNLILAVLLAVVGLAVIKVLVFDHMGTRLAAARKTIADLEKKVRDAEVQTKNAVRTQTRLKELTQELVKRNDEALPLVGNEFAWAARQVYNAGRELGRSDLEVREHGRTSSDGRFVAKVSNGPYFQTYAVKVTFKAGYFEIADLLALITQGNPCVTVSRLTVQASTNPEQHTVDLLLQWPSWERPEDLKKQQELAGS